MRASHLIAFAICFTAAPAFAQSCHGSSDFGGFSSPGFSVFDSGSSFMTSSPISYDMNPSYYGSLGTTASFLAPSYSAPISGFYSAASSFYSPQPSYAPMSYSSAPMSYSAPASYTPSVYARPAAMAVPASNCANGNCSQSASLGGGWSFGF